MYYSKSTNGFYAKVIHGHKIPDDAVEIAQECYVELLNGQSDGKVISHNGNGFPILKEYEPQPKTPEQLIAEQQQYLNQTDWIVVKINESMILGDDIKPLLEQYSDELSKRAEARELINRLGA